MKVYDFKGTPNGRRVWFFLKEKGLEAELVPVDIRGGENISRDYRENTNRFGRVPVLEMDDGTHLSESVAICRYLEETNPDNPLFGTTPLEKANVEMWSRRIELSFMVPLAYAFRNISGLFKDRENCFPDFGADSAKTANKVLALIEERLGESPWLAGDSFSIADITGICAVEFGTGVKVIPKDLADYPNITRWIADCAKRPGYAA